MPAEIYLVRHGATDYNVERRFYGREDVPLNALGLQQAVCLAERFAKTPFDVIYSSPLRRAVDTIRPVAALYDLPILQDGRLVEREAGEMSLTLIKDMYALVPEEQMNNLRHAPALFSYGNPEPASAVQARMVAALEDICKQHPNRRIGICSHAFSIRMLLNYAAGVTLEAARIALPNASVSKLVKDADVLHLLFAGDESHLPPDCRLRADTSYIFARQDED